MTSITFDNVRDRLRLTPPTEVARRPDHREAAVALVLASDGRHEPRVLFIKRADQPRDPWSGQMAFPGGRREEQDEDLYRTAVREAAEETALDLSAGSLLGRLSDLGPVTPHLPPIVVRPFVFGLRSVPPLRHSSEVALHIWVPLTELAAARTTETVHVRGQNLVVDGYRVGPHLIWGMTERILTPFMELLGGS